MASGWVVLKEGAEAAVVLMVGVVGSMVVLRLLVAGVGSMGEMVVLMATKVWVALAVWAVAKVASLVAMVA